MTEYAINPQVGDLLMVITGTQYTPDYRVRVTKTARIKFETVPANGSSQFATVWRKDTARKDGWSASSGPRIVTPEDYRDERRRSAAHTYLRTEVGIPSWDLKRTSLIDALTLANLIRKHLGLEEL